METSKPIQRNGHTIRLSEHFKCFSTAELTVERAADIMEERLSEYGPTKRFELKTFAEAKLFLLPLKSFTTRFLLLGYDGWTVVISDMRYENGISDANLLSRTANCRAMMVCAQEERREFAVFTAGTNLRLVESASDLGRWHFLRMGKLQSFEDPSEYTKANKKDRLSVAAVKRYFREVTGLEFPRWEKPVQRIIGLERSTRDILVPFIRFETQDDLPNV